MTSNQSTSDLAACPSEGAVQWLKGAIAAQGKGDLDTAERLYRKVLRHHPQVAMAYNNLGLVLRAKGKHQAAATCFRQALNMDSKLKQAHLNLGITLKDQNKLFPALEALKMAIAIDPEYADASYNMGLVLIQMGYLKQAVAAYQKAIQSKPTFPQAYNNAGIVLQELGRTREALQCFQQAVMLDSNNAMAHYNLSILHKFHGQSAEAAQCARKALDVAPDFSEARDILVDHLRNLCDWRAMADIEGCNPSVPGTERTDRYEIGTLGMFPELRPDYAQIVLDEARRRSQALESRSAIAPRRIVHLPEHWRNGDQRITIGYLSGNFRDHATAHLISDIFACHDRDRFKIDCYSYGENDHSTYRQIIERDSDRFIDLFNTESSAAAETIHANRVGILVDLNGHTACNRIDICAYRPAPLQARYLGDAKTSGAAFMDYLIGDPIITPEEDACWYTEKLVFMPNCYQVNSRPVQKVQPSIVRRSTHGLPDGGFVFCSFATSYKIDPILFACWLRLLKRVPQSVLWLLRRDHAVEARLKREAGEANIDPDRLIFTTALPKPMHLARLELADLCLDTRGVNGAATTSDALAAGVPVITIRGHHFVSRMSESILAAIGLPELAATDLLQYEKLAIALATDTQRLKTLREKLMRNRFSKPLFDTRRFVRNLENAFEQMWQHFLAGKPPQHIHVQDSGPSPAVMHDGLR